MIDHNLGTLDAHTQTLPRASTRIWGQSLHVDLIVTTSGLLWPLAPHWNVAGLIRVVWGRSFYMRSVAGDGGMPL